MMVVEIAFLVTLTSADTIVSMLAAKGLRDLAIAECLPNQRRVADEQRGAIAGSFALLCRHRLLFAHSCLCR